MARAGNVLGEVPRIVDEAACDPDPCVDVSDALDTVPHPLGSGARPRDLALDFADSCPVAAKSMQGMKSFKKMADEWTKECSVIGTEGSDRVHAPLPRKCCQDLGACRKEWKNHQWPFNKLDKFRSSLTRFIQGMCAGSSLPGTRAAIMKVVMFSGSYEGASVRRFALVAHVNDCPAFLHLDRVRH